MEQDFAKRRLRTPLAEPSPVSQPSSLGLLLTGLITGMVIGLFIALLVYLSGALPPAPGQSATAATDAVREVESTEAVSASGLTEEQQREAQRLQLEFYQELPNYEVVVDVTPIAGAIPRTPVTTQPAPASVENNATADTAASSNTDTTLVNTTVADTPAADAVVAGANSATPSAANEQLDPVSAALLEISNREARTQPPASALSTAAGGNFLLQAGAFQQQSTATAQLNRLLGLGLTARIREEILPGRTLYLVQAGPYSTRDDMMQAERVLRSNSIDSMRITLSQP